MSLINNIVTGLKTLAPIPLDAKSFCLSEEILSNLGSNNNLAFTYHKGLVVYCAEQQTRWEWRERKTTEEVGILTSDFVYPANYSIFGIDYSLKSYNFFPYNFSSVTNFLDKIKLDFDWKKSIEVLSKTPEKLPEKVTNSHYQREGYIGYVTPIIEEGEVVYPPLVIEDNNPPIPATLLTAYVLNLGVKINNFELIKDFNPTLVISRYSPSYKKKYGGNNPIYPSYSYKKGSFKISKENNPLKLSRIPLQASYQVIDFGQEHYFKTNKFLQITHQFGHSDIDHKLILSRGLKKSQSQIRFPYSVEQAGFTGKAFVTSKASVYLQFHIEITVNENKILTSSLGRLKMIASSTYINNVVDLIPGAIIPYGIEAGEAITKIYFKHT